MTNQELENKKTLAMMGLKELILCVEWMDADQLSILGQCMVTIGEIEMKKHDVRYWKPPFKGGTKFPNGF